MDAAPSQWPAWLRRHTAVDHLGAPGRFFAWLTIVLSLVMIVYVGGWNAMHYPVTLGYDAQPNAVYAHVLLDQHHIPTLEQTAESHQPPAYYFLAELAARAGHETFGWLEARGNSGFPESSYRGAQIFNVLLVFLSALCVLWLARVLAPRRPWVWAASVGFFAFLPVVSKTEAMFHPENLNLLCSAAATAAITDMYVRRRRSGVLLALTAAAVGLGLATRPAMIFVAAALVLGTGVAITDARIRQVLPWRWIASAGAAVLFVATPWVAYRAIVQHSGPLNQTSLLFHAALHPEQHLFADRVTSHAYFFDLNAGVFTHPWRSNFKNEAFPETYVEIWGDWLGHFAFSPYDTVPSAQAQRVLRDQSWIGVLPTALAICGWFWLAFATLRRDRGYGPLVLVPLIAVGAYLYRSYVVLTHDGDVFEATYAINSAPVWALTFGLAAAWVGSRSRLIGIGLGALFAIFAVLELRFMLYGIRDGHPIF